MPTYDAGWWHLEWSGVEWRRVVVGFGGYDGHDGWLATNGLDGSEGFDGADGFVDLGDFDASTRRY